MAHVVTRRIEACDVPALAAVDQRVGLDRALDELVLVGLVVLDAQKLASGDRPGDLAGDAGCRRRGDSARFAADRNRRIRPACPRPLAAWFVATRVLRRRAGVGARSSNVHRALGGQRDGSGRLLLRRLGRRHADRGVVAHVAPAGGGLHKVRERADRYSQPTSVISETVVHA